MGCQHPSTSAVGANKIEEGGKNGFHLCAYLMAASVHEENAQLACKIYLWVNLRAAVQRGEGRSDNEGREPCPTTLHLSLAFLPFLGQSHIQLSPIDFLKGGETKTNSFLFNLM